MARLDRHDRPHPARWRRSRTVAVAALLLALSACGFATTEDPGTADVTHEQATLSGVAYNTEVGEITYWFEYGPTDAYGTSTPVQSAEIVQQDVGLPVQATITGLDAETTYHFTLCVRDRDGYGICANDRTFTTDAPPPPPCLATFPGGTPYALGDGATVTATTDCAPVTGSIYLVCFDFTFVDNLFDPGEHLTIAIEGVPGFGFSNPTGSSLSDRTICSLDLNVEAFQDGQASFDVQLDPGTSATIDELRVRVLTS